MFSFIFKKSKNKKSDTQYTQEDMKKHNHTMCDWLAISSKI